jgi:hypothetical protein
MVMPRCFSHRTCCCADQARPLFRHVASASVPCLGPDHEGNREHQKEAILVIGVAGRPSGCEWWCGSGEDALLEREVRMQVDRRGRKGCRTSSTCAASASMPSGAGTRSLAPRASVSAGRPRGRRSRSVGLHADAVRSGAEVLAAPATSCPQKPATELQHQLRRRESSRLHALRSANGQAVP